MLITTMNKAEISREVRADYDIFKNSSTFMRLAQEYYHERIKLHVKKEAEYAKYYEIKSKSKNTWIGIFFKKSSKNKYQSVSDTDLIFFTYYYSENGICVLNHRSNGDFEIYLEHLFIRYREKMFLDLPNILDVVKCFMRINSLYKMNKRPEKDGKKISIVISEDGYHVGNYDSENQFWVHKTFIRNENACYRSVSERTKMINEIDNKLLNEEPDGDEEYYQDLKIYLESLNKEATNEKKNEKERVLILQKPKFEPVVQRESDFVAFIKNQAKTN